MRAERVVRHRMPLPLPPPPVCASPSRSVAGGELTDYDRELLESVDRMREGILDALTLDAVRLADLVGALDGEVSTGVFEAAVDELKASGEAELGESKCTSCYPPHPVQTISSRLRAG